MAKKQSTTEQEVWKPINSFSGYEASSLGRIRRSKPGQGARVGLILKTFVNTKNGYEYTSLQRDGMGRQIRSVHRLVCAAFHGDPPEDRPHVNHLNGVRTNNVPSNLEWTNRGGNMKHAFLLGNRSNSGESNPRTKLTVRDVLEIRKLAEFGIRYKTIAPLFNLTWGGVKSIVNRQNWRDVLG